HSPSTTAASSLHPDAAAHGLYGAGAGAAPRRAPLPLPPMSRGPARHHPLRHHRAPRDRGRGGAEAGLAASPCAAAGSGEGESSGSGYCVFCNIIAGAAPAFKDKRRQKTPMLHQRLVFQEGCLLAAVI
ncbi:unnamed protein product, partial [Urochloa humidicola]